MYLEYQNNFKYAECIFYATHHEEDGLMQLKYTAEEISKLRNWKRESLGRQVQRSLLKETGVLLWAVAP
jgi:hypothetical protein